MRTKRKMSITVDDELYDAIEKASETYNIAKSQVAQDAFKLWLKKKTEDLMVKGYVEMDKDDAELAELAFEAQKEALS